MIGVIDYGMGNLGSVEKAIVHLGYEVVRISDPQALANFQHVILPGVGSFALAMLNLRDRGWIEPIKTYAASGRPLAGVCLGMQLMLDAGDEHGPSEGLGLISGRAVLMQPGQDLYLPHVGWNSVEWTRRHPVLSGVKPHVDFYFVHSYHCQVTDPADVLGVSEYGVPFAASLARGNLVAFQFHPEKSQDNGLKLMENFCDWDGAC